MRKKLVLISLIVVLAIIVIFTRNTFMRADYINDVEIEWTDFIFYKGQLYHVEYFIDNADTYRVTVDDQQVDDLIGKIRFTLSDNIKNDSYEFREWDASFLKEGTRVYSLKNINSDKSFAAELEGQYYIYSVIE